jgi:hypothetical protein
VVSTTDYKPSRQLLYEQRERELQLQCCDTTLAGACDSCEARAREPKDNPVGPNSKPSNPKDIIGSSKLPLHLFPSTALAMGTLGFLNGALKYGRHNFRAVGVRASIYYDAALRHLMAWMEGEECDPEDGVPHLAAAMGCIAIIIDAEAAGKLTDDRNVAGGYRQLMDKLTPHVARLQALHAEKSPKHYTIADQP